MKCSGYGSLPKLSRAHSIESELFYNLENFKKNLPLHPADRRWVN